MPICFLGGIMIFSERLKLLRSKQKLSSKQVYESIGISQATYYRYETGEREPNCQVLIALSNFFNVSIDYLSGRVDTPFYTNSNITSQYSDAALHIAKIFDAVSPEAQRRIKRCVVGEYDDWHQASANK